MLFFVYVEDLELYLQTRDLSGLSFQDSILILLLFADDMFIFGHDHYDLQNSLNMLYEYCKRWGLKSISIRLWMKLEKRLWFLESEAECNKTYNFFMTTRFEKSLITLTTWVSS